MSVAFGQFTEPYAWLIRGLIEYGWQDLTLTPAVFPSQSGQGFDLNPFLRSGGVSGIRLLVLARDHQNNWYEQDKMYEFYAKLGTDRYDNPTFLIIGRSSAYSQFFPYVPEQPIYSAGYIHQGLLQEHIPNFVQSRKKGRELTVVERNELVDIEGKPCSGMLINFFAQRIRLGQNFDTAMMEGLWSSSYEQPAPQAQPPPQQPQYQPPQHEPQHPTPRPQESPPQNTPNRPQISSGRGRGHRIRGASVVGAKRTAALGAVERPAQVMQGFVLFAAFFGLVALANSGLTLYMVLNKQIIRVDDPSSYVLQSIIPSAVCGLYALIGGGIAFQLIPSYRTLQKGWKAWIPMLYCITLPICCLMGTPIALWALWTWFLPAVKEVRNT